MRERRLEVPPGREIRVAGLSNIVIRAAENDGDPIGFKGLAAVFNVRTRIGRSMWGFFEEIQPGAFEQSIGEDDIRMLKNHNTDLVCARNVADNLRLAEIKKGLDVDADMTPTTYVRDLALSLETGDVSQMSFGFEIKEEEWITLDDGDDDKGKVVEPELRIIKRVKLWEVSPVTFPAYVDTEAGLRIAELDELVRGRDLDDEMCELVAEFRSGKADPEKIRALAKGRTETAPAAPTDPQRGPSSDKPTGRTVDQIRRARMRRERKHVA